MDRYSIALKKKPHRKNAVQRAQELMVMDKHKLSPITLGYLYHRHNIAGFSTEEDLKALTHYAQAVEGLKTTNPIYKIDDHIRNWFKNPVPASYRECTRCRNVELMIGNQTECSGCDLPF